MPAEVFEDPHGIACVFSDGRRKRVVVGQSGPLVRDLLTGLAGLVHPHGTVDSPSAVAAYVFGARDIAGFMNGRGVRGGAGSLTRGLLAEYWILRSA